MKVKILLFLTVALLIGCATLTGKPRDRVIKDYDELSAYVGRNVVIEGVVSRTHGASGIYFNERDFRDQNDKCMQPQPFGEVRHGDKATLSGIIEETGCGSEKICTNICDKYTLKQANSISD